jgi:hypothetical protein
MNVSGQREDGALWSLALILGKSIRLMRNHVWLHVGAMKRVFDHY